MSVLTYEKYWKVIASSTFQTKAHTQNANVRLFIRSYSVKRHKESFRNSLWMPTSRWLSSISGSHAAIKRLDVLRAKGKVGLLWTLAKASLHWLASSAQVSQRSCFFRRLVRSSDRLRVSLRCSCHSTIVRLPGCSLAFCSRSYYRTDEVVSNKNSGSTHQSSLSAIVVKSLVTWSTLLFKRLANQVNTVLSDPGKINDYRNTTTVKFRK